MLRNLDQLEKHLDKEEFQETGSMDSLRVLKTQFQLFINFQYYFDDDEGLMIRKYFLAYTRTEVRQFRDTLIQHMEFVKKSIDERAKHKREYDRRGMKDICSQKRERMKLGNTVRTPDNKTADQGLSQHIHRGDADNRLQ
ncbi:hypothetical protein Tco_0793417 [Tanacetum coccineum]